MKFIVGVLIVVLIMLAVVEYQVEQLRIECKQAIADVTLVNAAILNHSEIARNVAISSLNQIEDAICSTSNVDSARVKLKRNRRTR